jgi:Lactonase, 7-bladed beta-propeller
MKTHRLRRNFLLLLAFLFCLPLTLSSQDSAALTQLPNGKLLGEVPGHPRQINNFPTAIALSPNGHFAVFLHSGYGAYTSGQKQSLTVLNLETGGIADFPDDRLGQHARQTYFLGLAFSLDGKHLFASMASLTDPLGRKKGDTGNGIAVYSFEKGRIAPERFIHIPPRTSIPSGKERRDEFKDVTYPAGLAVARSAGRERLLVACNNSDEAILLDTSDGKIIHRYDLSVFQRIPGSLPYTAVITSDGERGFVSLWNASTVAELGLLSGRVLRMIPLLKPSNPIAGGSHPTALLLNRNNSRLFVALTERDEIAVLDTNTGKTIGSLSTKLPGQKYGGSDPEYLALSPDEKTLFSANSISDSVGVFDLRKLTPDEPLHAEGFIPTEWYPTVVAATSRDLLIATAKGRGSGPNPASIGKTRDGRPRYPYNPAMIHGSLAVIPLSDIPANLSNYTRRVTEMNTQRGNSDEVRFAAGENKIRHVIYIIKENRTYDQLFGDIPEANGDPSIVMYGKDITPNEHKLALQFGVLDNFYDSGDVSGDGHIWSNSASISDYVEKTWPINYRSKEHTYDSEGTMLSGIALVDGIPYAGEPTGGFLWKDFADHGISYRHYGEFIVSLWCNAKPGTNLPTAGPPEVGGLVCPQAFINPGQPLPKNVGDPRGGFSPYPWPIPILARDIATAPELRGHFDPNSADFKLNYPDQFRVDEFLNEFEKFVANRKAGNDTMPQFIQLRLPNDHTAGGQYHMPTPSASVADNDLAVGRVVDAISHSPYWDDTAFLILEDDAQDGPDHVDSHRSICLVISKYSPLPIKEADGTTKPFVEHNFYTTINVVRTIEALLGVPPMNANDSRSAVMAPLFSGPGTQPPYTADYRNRDNRLIYKMNTKHWKEGKNMDFSRADDVNTAVLNKYLWQDRMGSRPEPAPQHHVFPADSPARSAAHDQE